MEISIYDDIKRQFLDDMRKKDYNNCFDDRISAKKIVECYDNIYGDIASNSVDLYNLAKENVELMEKSLFKRFSESGEWNELSNSSKVNAQLIFDAFNRNNKTFYNILDETISCCYIGHGKTFLGLCVETDYIWDYRHSEKLIQVIQQRQEAQSDELAKRGVMVRCCVRHAQSCNIVEFMKLYAECLSDKMILEQEKEKYVALQQKYVGDVEHFKKEEKEFKENYKPLKQPTPTFNAGPTFETRTQEYFDII